MFNALIDTGALITGLTNEEVARTLLKMDGPGMKNIEVVVFFSDNGEQLFVDRGGGLPAPLSRCGVGRVADSCFTIKFTRRVRGVRARGARISNVSLSLVITRLLLKSQERHLYLSFIYLSNAHSNITRTKLALCARTQVRT